MLSHLTPTAAATYSADAIEEAHAGESFVMMDGLRVYFAAHESGMEIGDVYRPVGARFQPVFITAEPDALALAYVIGEFDAAAAGEHTEATAYAVAAQYDAMMQDNEVGAYASAYGC